MNEFELGEDDSLASSPSAPGVEELEELIRGQNSSVYLDELPSGLEATVRDVEGSVFADVEVDGIIRPWLTCSFDEEGRLIGQTYVNLETGKTDHFMRFEYNSRYELERVIRYERDGTSKVDYIEYGDNGSEEG